MSPAGTTKVELPPAGMERVKLTEALLGRMWAKASRVQLNARPVDVRRERRERVERCMVGKAADTCSEGSGRDREQKRGEGRVGGRSITDR